MTQPLPDRIREALAKAAESAQCGDFDAPVKAQAALVFIADNIEALLAENDRLRAVAEAARWLYDHTNKTQPRHEAYWNQDAFIALGRVLAALDAAND